MTSNRLNLALVIGTVVLLLGTLIAAVWPVKSDYGVACGSFLSSSSTVYEDGVRQHSRMMANAAEGMSENSLGLPTGAFSSAASELAARDVENCGSRRQTAGIIAGVFVLLALGSGSAYFVRRQRDDSAKAG